MKRHQNISSLNKYNHPICTFIFDENVFLFSNNKNSIYILFKIDFFKKSGYFKFYSGDSLNHSIITSEEPEKFF